MALSIGEIVGAVWQRVMDESPVEDGSFLYGYLTGHRLSYRAQLDRPRRNYKGAVIPRIVLVRRNLSLLQKPPRPPRLPR